MPADLASHMPRFPFSTMINKYYCHVGKYFMLILILVIISYSISIEKDNLRILC